MALYQLHLTVVPRKGLLLKHGGIPDQVTVQIKDGCFYPMTEGYWSLLEVEPRGISHEIDRMVDRGNFGNDEFWLNWKTYTDKVDNDASLTINKETGKVEELYFRADLREVRLVFLMEMIELGRKYDWLFMDIKGNLVNPNWDEIKDLISKWNKVGFLKNASI
ncbi:hypothetical protein [Algivirga pacifica]|uniref:Uncharacterized protein n=1 Tax=Algivirga pacifica TaxID=1162670 RepID=A0ABP9DN00_9BACT